MKVMFASFLAAIVLAVAASFVLNGSQRTAYDAYATSGARVGEPGHNLVGPNWSGNNERGATTHSTPRS